jgi:hypothetical protein
VAAGALPLMLDQSCAAIRGRNRRAWCRRVTGRAAPAGPIPAGRRASGDGSVFASKKPSAIDFANSLDWIMRHRRSPWLLRREREPVSQSPAPELMANDINQIGTLATFASYFAVATRSSASSPMDISGLISIIGGRCHLPESISSICRSITAMTKRENGPRSRYKAASIPK